MKNRLQTWPRGVSALLACSLAAASYAQQAPLPAGAQVEAETIGLEEVVVTAQRREENLQKASAAITVLDPQQLANAGVTEVENLNKLAPGLAVGIGGPSTQIYLRGVGSYGTNAFADPAVQFNVDGIAYGRVTGLNGNFFDLQRVEVLKGPQGTLYGRNATGGSVNLVTAKPQDEFSANVGAEFGNYSLQRYTGHVNVPLGDKWAMRVAGQYTSRDGYQTDGTNDEDSTSGRLHVQYAPSDNFNLLLSASIVQLEGIGFGQVPYRASGYYDNGNPWTGPATAAPALLQAQATANGQPPTLFTNGVAYTGSNLDVEVKSYGAVADIGVGAAGTLTLIANRLETDNFSKSYGPGFKFWPDDTAEQTTIEARLSGSNDRMQWVGGLFYYTEDQTSKFWVDQGFLFNQTGADIQELDDETKAVYGQVTFSFTDTLRGIAGLRYTEEEKSVGGQMWNRQGAPCAVIGWTPATIADIAANIPQAATNDNGVAYPFPYCRDTVTGDKKWDDTSWTVGLEFDATDTSMLYAKAARGFKAGGFFASGDHSTVGNSYDPEELIAYSIGSKNTFSESRVRLNAEIFYWDYRDHQEGYLAPTNAPNPGFGFITINVPKAEIYGLDVELDWAPTEADRLGLRLQYLKAEYTDFVYNTSRPGEFQNGMAGSQPPSTVCPYTLVSIGFYSVDCTGQEMPRSPELSVQADYSHTFVLSGGASITPGVGVQYSDAYWTAVDYNPLQRQDSFFMYDVFVNFTSASGRWNAGLYGRNLGDEAVWQNSFVHPSGVAFNALRPPQTYGGRIEFNF